MMLSILKSLAESAASLFVLPAVCAYHAGRLLLGTEKAFPAWPQLLGLIPGITGAYVRRAFYRMVLGRCGAGSWISFGTVFSHSTAEVGRDVYVGCYCCLGDVTLEDDVLLGSQVSIMNGAAQHGTERLCRGGGSAGAGSAVSESIRNPQHEIRTRSNTRNTTGEKLICAESQGFCLRMHPGRWMRRCCAGWVTVSAIAGQMPRDIGSNRA
jgi:hypothetical protein